MAALRVGVIGGGRITGLHALAYDDYPKAEVYAVCDVDEDVARTRAQERGVERRFTDYREMLAKSAIDAVEVITPHHLHAAMTVDALEAGKHVSVQKPMALNVTECDAMIDAAERTGKNLRVFENFQYYPPMAKAKELLDSGEIGEPISMRLKTIQGSLDGGEKSQAPPTCRRPASVPLTVEPPGGRRPAELLEVRPEAERRWANHPGLGLPPLQPGGPLPWGRGEGIRVDHPAEDRARLDTGRSGDDRLEIQGRRALRQLGYRLVRRDFHAHQVLA